MQAALTSHEANCGSLAGSPSGPPRHNEAAAARFCRWFAYSLVAMLTAVASLNFVANPFAQYPLQLLPPIVQLSRIDKLALLDRYRTAPPGLVLGSSRVMKLEPTYLEHKTGIQFFNAGVNYAVTADHLAWFRHYLDCYRQAPEMVLIGLDLSSFSSAIKPDVRLVTNPTLSRQLPAALQLEDCWTRWKELLAWPQTRESLRLLKYRLCGAALPEPLDYYRPNGLLIYRQSEQQLTDGTFDLQGPLEFSQREYEARYRYFEELSPRRLGEFQTLVDECQRHGTMLVVFVTSMHPDLIKYLSGRTEFQARHADLIAFLTGAAADGGFAFSDMTHVTTYDGDPAQFIDGLHQLEPNTRKLIDTLLQRVAVTGSRCGARNPGRNQ